MTDLSNHVSVAGRVSQSAKIKTLPSGDQLATFRIIVDRPAAALRRSKQKVDTFDCAAWTAKLRRKVETLQPGQPVLVTGQLRRRFTRVGGVPASFVTIEINELRKGEASG